MELVIFSLLGLVVGSFLNVVIFRFRTGESPIFGRSHCGHCQAPIPWYDNIPILSFLLLFGKCRNCGVSISWQYPVVELATAVLFAAVAKEFFVLGDLPAAIETTLALGVVAVLIVIFAYDLSHMEIPVSALMFGTLWIVFGLFFLWYFALPREAFLDSRLASGLIGGVISFLLFYALVFFSKETWMGMGDAWLAFILGLVVGWELLLPTLTLAFGSGALIGVVLIAAGKKEMQSRIPFGPFLATSVIFMMLFGRMVEGKFLFPGWWV